MAEPPRKKLKAGSHSILSFFQRMPTCGDNSESALAANVSTFDSPLAANERNEDHDFLTESETLPAANEKDDCTSESQSNSESLMTDLTPDPEPGSTATSTTTLGEPSQLPVVGPYDIGAIKSSLLRGRLSDDDKYSVLKQLDQPQHYQFPAVMEGQQLRRFQSSWFSKYPWLTYSRSENGGYCAFCLAFAPSIKIGGNLRSLVQTPLIKFKKALETLAFHEKTQHHKDAYTRVEAFLAYMSKERASIASQLNTLHATQIQKNRKVLKSIIATVELCGRQGIALRGTEMMENTLKIVIIILVTFKLCLNFGVMPVTLL